MAELNISGTPFTSELSSLLNADDIQPGSQVSYQSCKDIYVYHPLGGKMADAPISLAQSQRREISIPNSPEDKVRDAYMREWDELSVDSIIFTLKSISRVYGIGSVAMLIEGLDPSKPVPYKELYKKTIVFNVFDPLNTAGSLVLNQDPNAMDFQKAVSVQVQGVVYHRTRTCTVMNESPMYIKYTISAFGYVGRSVYQRGLYPLKSFLHTMITDDMVSRKAGLLVAKIKQAGSIIDNLMVRFTAMKRALLKQAQTDNVISISPDEEIESLNLQNLDKAGAFARTNIIKNIATSADMPAVLLENETLTEGFGEGTEDAKNIAKYIDRFRREMNPIYAFFDKIVQWRAWNPEFYATIQAEFKDEYGKMSYEEAFYQWQSSFTAEWPSLLIEPESEQIKVEETKYKAITELVKTLSPLLPNNVTKAQLIEWAQDNYNENKMIFPNPLNLDTDEIANTPDPIESEVEPDEPAKVKPKVRAVAGGR